MSFRAEMTLVSPVRSASSTKPRTRPSRFLEREGLFCGSDRPFCVTHDGNRGQ